MVADLNILKLEDDHIKLLQDAIKNDESHVKIGKKKYPTHLLTEEDGLLDGVLVHNIESYQYQKLKRDVIIKFVETPKLEDIFYIVSIIFLIFNYSYKAKVYIIRAY